MHSFIRDPHPVGAGQLRTTAVSVADLLGGVNEGRVLRWTGRWCSVAFCLELKRELARITFCRMSAALFVQVSGLGFVLWWATYSSMAVVNSGKMCIRDRHGWSSWRGSSLCAATGARSRQGMKGPDGTA